MLKKILAGLLCGLGIAVSSVASAATFTYDLNRVLAALTPTSGWGTVTISDYTTNTVMIEIDLAGNYKPLGLYLNYANCNNSLAFFTNPSFTSGTDATVDCNAEKANGYGDANGTFDISIPDNGNLGNVNDIDFVLYAYLGSSTVNLNAADFNVLDQWGNLFVALHVGNLPNGQSIWLGSAPTSNKVPEPGTLGLLGAGLFGLALVRRRVRK
ncbi:MAG: PEP-CTERM sorting domain-containing protein [Burkholderiaceae bacterium]|nr:PEP-CTERM sorting domain-containing protein [Burkholderiaceae bacterium]